MSHEKLTKRIMEEYTLFTDGNDGYIAFKANGRQQVEKITSRNTRRMIRQIARKLSFKINGNIAGEVADDLDAEAVFSGYKGKVFNRIGKTDDGRIIYNPVFENGHVIVISPGAWTIEEPFTHRETIAGQTPIMVNTNGMLSMPHPVKGQGELADLHRFFRTKNDKKKFILIIAFIIQSFFYDGPFPIIVIVAEPGSGKTFITVTIKNLIDPHEAPTLSVPKDPAAMFSTAGVCWLLAYDNFSKVKQWLSDLFCRFSTGGATIDRLLFTNGEAFIASAKRPAVVNGINDFFSQSDVLQRSIILENNRIEPGERIDEAELLRDFNDKLPGIFHDILDLLAAVLEKLPSVTVSDPTRMADFCKIGTATALCLGYDENFFMDAYRENLKQANDITLESNVVTPVLKSYIDVTGHFKGAPSELWKALGDHNPDAAKSAYWPKTATVLSGILKRLAPNFRETGISIETGREHEGRWIEICKGDYEHEIPFA